MSIYISWKNTIVNTPERFIANFFNYLSPRWYPVNIIKSEIYTVFNSYAQEFSSASVELTNTFNDLNLLLTRVTPISTRTTSKIYDNFGSNIGISKLYEQNYDSYNTGSLLQSYRMELKTLLEGFNSATTVESYYKTGQAFTGVTPLIFDHTKHYLGWRTGLQTSSVVDIGEGLLIGSNSFPWIGRIFSTGSTTFSINDLFGISYSVLGLNTYITSKNYKFQDIEVYMYGSSSVSTSLISAVQSAFDKVKRANQKVNIYYKSGHVYTRPSLLNQSLSTPLYTNAEYLTNISLTYKYGVSYETPVLQLPANYQNYDWYYDWNYSIKNTSFVKLFYRSYSSNIIPSTVYYQEYNKTPVEPLPYSSASIHSQYLLQDKSTIWDVGGNGINLKYIYYLGGGGPSPITSLTYIRSRNRDRLGIKNSIGTGVFYTGSVESILTFGDSFYGEMWAYGINSLSSGTGSIIFKHDNIFNSYSTLNTGFSFGINFPLQQAFLSIAPRIGDSVTNLTASISPYLQQSSSLPHYFAFSFSSKYLAIYCDGNKLASSSVNLTFPVANSYSGIDSLMITQLNAGIDEFGVGAGFLSYEDSIDRFNLTKPRFHSSAQSSSSVKEFHQSKVILYGSGSYEIELHQFSIRPYNTPIWTVVNNNDIDILRYPIFKLNTALKYLSI